MNRARGYSLIEVMVTLAIVSFGLLGVTGIIITNLKNSHHSYLHTQASILTSDIIGKVRANRPTAESSPSPRHIELSNASADLGSVAGNDIDQWRMAIAAALPEGKGFLTLNPATDKVRVVVQWVPRSIDRNHPESKSEMQRIVIETRL